MKFRTAALLVLAASLPASARDITAAFMPDLYPFSYSDDDGAYSGFYIDLLDEASDALGLDVTWVRGTWSENFEAGVRGDIDLLISVTYTPERDEYLDYCPETVLSNWTQVIRHRDSGIESVLDLDERNVGIMTNDQNGAALLEFVRQFNVAMNVLEYPDHGSMCRAIEAGEIAAGAIPNFFDISSYPRIDRTAIIFNAFSTTYATAEGTNAALLADLGELIAGWKDDESSPYARLFREYFSIYSQTVIPRWLTTLAGILALASLASWLIVRRLTLRLRRANADLENWNQTLEEKVARRSRELEESRDQLILSEKMAALGRMVAGVAHEINTPIGIALTASTFLKENVQKVNLSFGKDTLSREDFIGFLSTADSSVDMINTNIIRAAAIIRSFKEISVDQNVDEERSINLKEYGEAILTSLFPRIKRTGHRYELEADDAVVRIQPGSLAQVITNLFENALVHGFEGKENGLITVRLTFEDEPSVVVLEVEDDGRGIDPGIRESMYEPFVSSRRFNGSTGLGLNIVHNLVVGRLGGDISVRTEPGEGTCFRITLPVN